MPRSCRSSGRFPQPDIVCAARVTLGYAVPELSPETSITTRTQKQQYPPSGSRYPFPPSLLSSMTPPSSRGSRPVPCVVAPASSPNHVPFLCPHAAAFRPLCCPHNCSTHGVPLLLSPPRLATLQASLRRRSVDRAFSPSPFASLLTKATQAASLFHPIPPFKIHSSGEGGGR